MPCFVDGEISPDCVFDDGEIYDCEIAKRLSAQGVTKAEDCVYWDERTMPQIIADAWNEQADTDKQWDELSENEKIEFAFNYGRER